MARTRECNRRFEMRLTEEEEQMLDKQRGLVPRSSYIRYLIREAHRLPQVPGFTDQPEPGSFKLKVAGKGTEQG